MTLFLLACTTGTVVLGSPDDSSVTTDDSADTGEKDTEPPDNAAMGSWSGSFGLRIDDYDMDICEGEFALEVDAVGALAGEGLCFTQWGGQEFPASFTGEVDEDGGVSGEVVFEVRFGGGGGGGETQEIAAELSGGATDDALELSWVGSVTAWQDQEVDVQGAGAGARQ